MKTILVLTHTTSEEALMSSYVYYHSKAISKLGNRVILFAINNYFPFFKKKIKKEIKTIDGIEIHFLNRISFSNFLENSKINLNGLSYYNVSKKEIKKILKKEKIDFIDAHYFKVEGYAAYRLKNKYNIKTSITLHGTTFTNSFNSINGKKDILKIAKRIDYFICVSEKLKKMLDTLKINNSKIIYNGINFFKSNNLIKNDYSIITIGSFTSDKNIDVVIKSFKKVLAKFPEAHLTIVGSGILKEKLENMCYNIIDNVKFTGQITNDEVYKYLNQTNIFILPSSPEGFGIVYAEAMYNKCITIGTKGEGIDGFIKDKENGFLVSIDENKIADLILDILNNKYDLNKIREKAYLDAKQLTWDKNAKEYIKIINNN